MKDTRWEKMVAKVQIVSARDGMGPVVLRSTAVMLLARQHAAVVRAIRKRGREYMTDAKNLQLTTHSRAVASAQAWAFKDFADDLTALAKPGSRKNG